MNLQLMLYSSMAPKKWIQRVSIVREINEQKDFYISVDLTTKEWSEKTIINRQKINCRCKLFHLTTPQTKACYRMP